MKLKTLLLIGAFGLASTVSFVDFKVQSAEEKTKNKENERKYKKCHTKVCNNKLLLHFINVYNEDCRYMFDELCEYAYIYPDAQERCDNCLEQMCNDNAFLDIIQCYETNCKKLMDYVCDDYFERMEENE